MQLFVVVAVKEPRQGVRWSSYNGEVLANQNAALAAAEHHSFNSKRVHYKCLSTCSWLRTCYSIGRNDSRLVVDICASDVWSGVSWRTCLKSNSRQTDEPSLTNNMIAYNHYKKTPGLKNIESSE